MERLGCTRACLSDISVIMPIMRVSLVELLCQVVMGWIPALEYLLPDARWVYDHVLSYQVVNVTAS
jgi:hypothetical protein